MNKKIIAILFLCGLFQLVYTATLRVNLLQPYDTLIRPKRLCNHAFQVDFFGERGIRKAQGYNDDGHPVNVLRIWDCDQSSIKMLDGFDVSTAIGQRRVRIDANDNGVRGRFLFDGDLNLDAAFAVGLRYFVRDYVSVSAYLSFYQMRLSNLCLRELTEEIVAPDFRVKDYLTNNFCNNVNTLACGLDLSNWKRTGVGDLALLTEFSHIFSQPMRQFLKGVTLNGRLGLSLPTGLIKDEDKIFAVPFGYDGSVGIIFGGGLDVNLGYYFQTGFDVQLIHLFGNTRDRRIKTASEQTELLLAAKIPVYKDWGLTQRFNLYGKFTVGSGLSLLFGYQFFQHNDDEISCSDCSFSNDIASDSRQFFESTIHQVVINLSYDARMQMKQDACVWPYVSVYARIPFNGINSAPISTVGMVVSFDF